MKKIPEYLHLTTSSDHIQVTAGMEFMKHIPPGGGTILDIGSGPGHHAKILEHKEYDVTCVDYVTPIYDLKHITPDQLSEQEPVDAVWSHHCLEHIRDPIGALMMWRSMLKPDGILYLTVPQIDDVISSGHINSFTRASIMYILATAGFDCSNAKWIKMRSHIRFIAYNSNKPSDFYNTGLPQLIELLPTTVVSEIKDTGRFGGNYINQNNWF
jgi:SAM-dependent methyltransferase